MSDPNAKFKFCLHRFARTTEEAAEINAIVDREVADRMAESQTVPETQHWCALVYADTGEHCNHGNESGLTPDPAPAVVSHTPVQYDAGCVSHGMTTERHCAADGHPMPDSAVVPEWSGPSTEADDAEDHGDGYLIAPAVVPDVEAAWMLLTADIADALIRHDGEVEADIIAQHRPLIEAAIRAEGRGALDVDTIEGSLGRFKWRLLAAQGTKRMFASALAAALDEALAQRDPAESQP